MADDDYKLVVMGTYAQAMWTAQLLELALQRLAHLQLRELPDDASREEITARFVAIFRKTAGQAARILDLPEDLAKHVKSAIRVRNRLAHDYLLAKPTRWESDEGLTAIFRELITMSQLLYAVEAELEPEIERLMRERGARVPRRRKRDGLWDLMMRAPLPAEP